MSDDDRPDVLNQLEVENYVEALQTSKYDELGSLGWLEKHERIKQLTIQSVIQALSQREETVKEALITHDKLKVLVHDLILVELFREQILPQLVKKKPTQTFTIYPILYHECTCINLLETVLYHHETSETLGEAIVDLTDYCLRQLNYFITVGNDDEEEASEEDVDLQKVSGKLLFGNCFKALSTIRYIIENLESLGSGLTSRLIVSSDTPMLLTQLLLQKPWRHENWQTNEVKEFDPASATWKRIESSNRLILGPTDVQIWLALYLILRNNEILSYYELYEGRRTQLLKLRPFLNDFALEQLPILSELQIFLNQLSVQAGQFTPSKSPLLLELIPPIRDHLEKKFKDEKKSLVKIYSQELLDCSKDILMEKAKRLASSYDFSNFEPTLPPTGSCANCSKEAEKRCSKCKSIFYCSRDCQVEHWKIHKVNCGNN